MPQPKIIQIEVTTACQLRCGFCPRTVLAKQWVTAHLSGETFSCLLPFLRQAKLVHLQGWGEPLLHPRFWDMAAAIKEKRGRVSLTTNGLLLDEAAAQEVCQLGLDLVAVSVAGAQAATNDALRVGSHLDQICANIAYLCQRKPRPKVHLVMQMMKPNLEELPELVGLAARLGADAVIAPNLDYAPTEAVDTLRAFAPSPDPHYAELVEEAKRKGKELGVKVSVYALSPREDILVCDADPVHHVWISVSGEVAPCPYVALPSSGSIPRLFWGKKEEFPRFSFGKAPAQLEQIWNDPPTRAFREAFVRRWQAGQLRSLAEGQGLSLPKVFSSSAAFFESLAQMTAPGKTTELPPTPEICHHCYKLYGL